MARHAAALVNNARLNPYRSFQQQKKRSRERFWTHHLLGNSTRIQRYKALPKLTGYVHALIFLLS